MGKPKFCWLGLVLLVIALPAAAAPARILLVPGHDALHWGTEYQGVKEADLTLQLAEPLFTYLNSDPAFQVFSSRDFTTGDYSFGIATYFEYASTTIDDFSRAAQTNFKQALTAGTIKTVTGVTHNFAPTGVGYILEGLNKWANDHNIDLALHVHLNDYPGHDEQTPGEYDGFAIYVPESQFNNASSSLLIAQPIFKQLHGVVASSTYPPEAAGIVPDQDLIAIGARNSRTGASMLIEYGYIYEPAIINPALRALYFPELAYQSYRGLKQAFGQSVVGLAPTTLLPYTFKTDLKKGMSGKPEVLRLQKIFNCSLTGYFGDCTLAAVTAFQKKYSIPATGLVGPLTRAKLNQLYGK